MNALWKSTTGIWLLLSTATVITTWVLSKKGFDPRLATSAIVLIAAWKVRLVLLHFMELRHAPLPLRLLFEAWVLLAAGVILLPYLLTPLARASPALPSAVSSRVSSSPVYTASFCMLGRESRQPVKPMLTSSA